MVHNGVRNHIIAFSDHLEVFLGLSHLLLKRPAIYACEPDWSWRPPVFSDFDLWIVLGGVGKMTVNGNPHPLTAGTAFLLQPNDALMAHHDPAQPLTVFACHMRPRRKLDTPHGRVSPKLLHATLEDVHSCRALAEKIVQAHQAERAPHGLTKLLLAKIILEFLLTDTPRESSGKTRNPFGKLAMDIQASPGESWTLAEMAKRSFLSVPQFNRKFRQNFGTSPRQFVIREKIRRAIHLLRESDLSIAQIADSLGYADHFFFHRQFKAATGITPIQARKGMPARFDESA